MEVHAGMLLYEKGIPSVVLFPQERGWVYGEDLNLTHSTMPRPAKPN